MIKFTPDEKRLVLELLGAHLRRMPASDPNLAPIASAFGRVSGGDYMTLAESDRHLPKRWYISNTGRKLARQPDDAMPITPRRYAEAKARVLYERGLAARART